MKKALFAIIVAFYCLVFPASFVSQTPAGGDLFPTKPLEVNSQIIEQAGNDLLIQTLGGFLSAQSNLPIDKSIELARTLDRCTSEHEVPLTLVLAIIRLESNFKPHVSSKANAIGLMGIVPHNRAGDIWFKRLKKEGLIEKPHDLYDPNKNVACGAYILRTLLDLSNNDMDRALRMYRGCNDRPYFAKIKKYDSLYRKMFEPALNI